MQQNRPGRLANKKSKARTISRSLNCLKPRRPRVRGSSIEMLNLSPRCCATVKPMRVSASAHDSTHMCTSNSADRFASASRPCHCSAAAAAAGDGVSPHKLPAGDLLSSHHVSQLYCCSGALPPQLVHGRRSGCNVGTKPITKVGPSSSFLILIAHPSAPVVEAHPAAGGADHQNQHDADQRSAPAGHAAAAAAARIRRGPAPRWQNL